MPKKSKSIEKFLENSRLSIANALIDEEIKSLLLPYTYDEARLNEGMAFYKEIDALYEKQKNDYVKQYEAQERFSKAQESAHNAYIEHVVLTRLALKDDPSTLKMLALDGRRRKMLAAWLRQLNRYYHNAIDNEEVLEKISRYGITNDKLKEGQKLVKEVELRNDEHERAKGTAQISTNERNKLLKRFDRWMTEFINVCRFAFKSQPQLLEKLGITVLTEGYKRKPKDKETEEVENKESETVDVQEHQNL
jgi:hypothetical protein